MSVERAYDEDPYDDHDDDTPPYWFAGQHLPRTPAKMGLNHTVPEGALLDFAGSLDSTKPCTASPPG